MLRLLLVSLVALCAVATHAADDVGTIVYAKGNEFILPSGPGGWQPAEYGRALQPGDRLRTGTHGALALLLIDETQVRLRRNSEFVVSDVRDGAAVETTTLSLIAGAIWSRTQSLSRTITAAARTRRVLNLKAKNSTIGIRGTDWHVSIDPKTGADRVVILSGAGEVFNEFGRVELASGEEAVVEPGKAPNKRVVVDLKGRPLMALEYRPRWLDMLTIYEPLASQLAGGGAAAAAYDNRNYAEAAAALPQGPGSSRSDDQQAVAALVAARGSDYDGAIKSLDQIASPTPLTQLIRVSVLMSAGDIEKAVAVLESLPQKTAKLTELFRTVVQMWNSDYDAAIATASAGVATFPDVPTFHVLLAHSYLLTDEPDRMLAEIDAALAINADDPGAWHVRGLFYTIVEPNEDEVVRSYERAIELNPQGVESWHNYAQTQMELGHIDEAKAAMATAREVGPDEPLVLASSGTFAQLLDRLDDAETYLQQATRADPNHPTVHVGLGYQALNKGDTDTAIKEFLAAITINPVQPGAHTALATAYYQAGRFAAAQATISKAIEVDPDDPIAPQIGSAFNVDQANIGEAIRLAKDALRKSEEFDYFAVESYASARSGITNIGSAYSSLGLGDWANYYAQLAFTPYLANSHFLLSTVYSPRGIRASNGALNLAFQLEPTSLSIPNRYFEFVRQPGNYVSLGGSYGTEDGAETRAGNFTAQGFQRLPIPIAYRLDYSDTDNDGYRLNSQSNSKSLNVSVGTRFDDRRHHLAANLFALKSNSGDPGPQFDPDLDDRNKTSSLSASLAYHLRLDFDNRILARVGYQSLGIKFRNGRPLGSQTTDLVESFLFFFGEERTRELLGLGLTDLNPVLDCTTTDPCVGVGSFFTPFGDRISGVVPDVRDDNPIRATDSFTRSFTLQLRHMFTWRDVDFTYGAEWIKQESRSKTTNNNFDLLGAGFLIDDLFFIELFPLFETFSETGISKSDPDGIVAYTQARYKYSEDLWFDVGIFGRYYDDEISDSRSQLDPRVGMGWRIFDKHWLRVGYQRELVMPVPNLGPIAPVAVMGFVAPLTEVLNGSSFQNFQAQWDAEWHARVFTSVRFEEQHIDGWSPLSSPGSLDLFAGEARIRSVDVALNLWLFERFGFAAKYVYTDAENQDNTVASNTDLPLKPESAFSMGLNWIHPLQIRASVGATYVGDRYGDVANTIELDDYWTTSASINWQPLDRHLSIGVSVINLLNEDFDLAFGFPAPGPTATVSLQARF